MFNKIQYWLVRSLLLWKPAQPPLSIISLLTMFILSGYDFGYFVKLLTAVSLPTTEEAFFELLRIWFPTVYDIKFMMRASNVLKGGLQEVADDLGVR
jgi:mRNA deadenylase subunit